MIYQINRPIVPHSFVHSSLVVTVHTMVPTTTPDTSRQRGPDRHFVSPTTTLHCRPSLPPKTKGGTEELTPVGVPTSVGKYRLDTNMYIGPPCSNILVTGRFPCLSFRYDTHKLRSTTIVVPLSSGDLCRCGHRR